MEGVLWTAFGASSLAAEVTSNLLLLLAGGLVYVGAMHLFPQAEHEHRKYSLVALSGGILVAAVIMCSKA